MTHYAVPRVSGSTPFPLGVGPAGSPGRDAWRPLCGAGDPGRLAMAEADVDCPACKKALAEGKA